MDPGEGTWADRIEYSNDAVVCIFVYDLFIAGQSRHWREGVTWGFTRRNPMWRSSSSSKRCLLSRLVVLTR